MISSHNNVHESHNSVITHCRRLARMRTTESAAVAALASWRPRPQAPWRLTAAMTMRTTRTRNCFCTQRRRRGRSWRPTKTRTSTRSWRAAAPSSSRPSSRTTRPAAGASSSWPKTGRRCSQMTRTLGAWSSRDASGGRRFSACRLAGCAGTVG